MLARVPCRVCSKPGHNEKLIARDYFLGTKKEYEYEICSYCGSLFLIELPSNLHQLYEKYYSFSPPKHISPFRRWLYTAIVKKKWIPIQILSLFLNRQEDLPIKSLASIKIQSASRIVDVGCGSGFLLDLLYEMGFKNCLGIDPFLSSDKESSKGVVLKKSELFALTEKFDLVMFHHVFEHFPRIDTALKHVYHLLSDQGVCIIRMPDIDSFSFLRYRNNWFSIHAPFHTALPSRQGMESLAKECGLVIEKIVGEQLIEFFFYSKGHELGVSDYERYGNRRFFEKYGSRRLPPLHIKNEMLDAVQRLRQVKKYDLCDWAVYYLRKK